MPIVVNCLAFTFNYLWDLAVVTIDPVEVCTENEVQEVPASKLQYHLHSVHYLPFNVDPLQHRTGHGVWTPRQIVIPKEILNLVHSHNSSTLGVKDKIWTAFEDANIVAKPLEDDAMDETTQ